MRSYYTVFHSSCTSLHFHQMCMKDSLFSTSSLTFTSCLFVSPKGNLSWIFIERTDAETPILYPPDVKNWLIWKDPDAGKNWRWEKGTTEDEMVGWHHWLDGHEFEKASGVGDGQGGLVCCNPWGCKVRHDWATELNWFSEYCLCSHISNCMS